MILHYLKSALRQLRREPASTLISITTLALGLVCFLVAYAVIAYWEQSDRQFANSDRTYVITASLDFQEEGIRTGTFASTNEFFARYLRAEFPELEAVARVAGTEDVSIGTAERGFRGFRAVVDQEFLDVFDLPFIAGDRQNALRQPRSVVLTQASAERLFGDANPVGQPLTLSNSIETTVTGVVGPVPEPSHIGASDSARLPFDILTSWDLRTAVRLARNPDGPEELPETWFGGYCCLTYVVLPADGSLDERSFLARLEGFGERRLTPEQRERTHFTVGAVPLGGLVITDLNNQLFGSASDYLSVTTVLMLLGGLILGVACINYANLATARAAGRGRDVGLRRVVGAKGSQIMAQYFVEAGLLVLAAAALAVVAFAFIAPVLDANVGIDVVPIVLSLGEFWLFMLATLAAVTLAAGAYPAFVLSRLRPIETLRLGQRRTGPRFVATVLVGTQFVAASFLLIVVLVVNAQNGELRRAALGLNADPLLVIDNASQLTGVSTQTLLDELRRIPQVRAVTAASTMPWGGGINVGTISRSPDGPELDAGRVVFFNFVGPDFFDVFDMPLLAGREFDLGYGEDVLPDYPEWSPDRPLHAIVDRSAAEALGFATPAAAVERQVYFPMPPDDGRPAQPIDIVGVVEDRPLHFRGGGASGNMFAFGGVQEFHFAQIARDDVPTAITAIDAMWQRLSPLMPRSRRFLDEVFEQNYETFDRVNRIFVVLALTALFISLVGLFAIAMQVAARRLHEIGVRKTLGATTRQLVAMLLLSFARPVIVANLIAWPLAFFVMRFYLNVFMHRIPLTPLPFVTSLALTVAVAGLAVAGHAYRAARVEPARVLRAE